MEGVSSSRLLLFVLLMLIEAVSTTSGQVCQQSLPLQYVPEADIQSTTPSSVGTLYVYPNAFSSTQCVGRVTSLQYSFCYAISQSFGLPPDVFTALLLGNATNSYTVLNLYTEREDRECDPMCCKTVDIELGAELTIQSDLALGIVIPSITGSNFLYAALNERSIGFTVSTTGLPSITSVGSTISKSSLGQSPTLINNRRFSLTFETQTAVTRVTTVATITQGNTRNGYEGVVAGVLSVMITTVVILLLVAVGIGICYKYSRLRKVPPVADNQQGNNGEYTPTYDYIDDNIVVQRAVVNTAQEVGPHHQARVALGETSSAVYETFDDEPTTATQFCNDLQPTGNFLTIELNPNNAYTLEEPATTTSNESYDYPAVCDH